MKNKCITAIIISLMASLLAGCGANSKSAKIVQAESSEPTKPIESTASNSDEEDLNDFAFAELEDHTFTAPEAWGGRSLEEYVEYIKSSAVSEYKHEPQPYVSDYSGDYEEIEYSDGNETVVILKDSRVRSKYYEKESVSYEEIEKVIDNNKYIDDPSKEFIKDFAKTMIDFYPDMDTRLLYENLISADIIYITREEMGENIEGKYNSVKGNIYLLNGTELREDSKDAAIIRHELGHASTIFWGEKFDSETLRKTTYKDGMSFIHGRTTEETLNTLFASDPFLNRYSEEALSYLGYAAYANVYRAIFKLFPDTRIENIFKNDIYYFEEYLNNQLPGEQSGSKLINAIDEHYIAPDLDSRVEIYKSIIQIVADSYISRAVSDELSEEEVLLIRDALKLRLFKNAPFASAESESKYLNTLSIIDDTFQEYLDKRN